MTPRAWIVVAGLVGATGVGLGALGAHGLRDTLLKLVAAEPTAPEVLADNPEAHKAAIAAEVDRRVEVYETAVRYQMYHAPAILLAAVLGLLRPSHFWNGAAWAFLFGVLVFSGLLYVLVFTGVKILGMIVPIGGVSLIVGWVLLAAGGKTLLPPGETLSARA